jgi:hypothetical protein
LRNPTRPSVTAVDSCYPAQEHTPRKSSVFLGRASSWSTTPTSGIPRSISLGSIDELRCNSFVSARRRVFSMPTIPSRQSSLVDSTCSTKRRYPRTLSVCDVDDLASLSQLRRDPMFVDIQEGHQVNFVFPPSSDMHSPSVSPPRLSTGSKAHSYKSLRHREPNPLLLRSSSITGSLGGSRGEPKIPLFVPSQIIKPAAGKLLIPERQSSRLSPDAAFIVGDATQDEHPRGRENRSKETLSEESDWSTTVQFEAPKQEVFQPQSEISAVANVGLPVKQELQTEVSRSWETRRDAQGRATPPVPDRADRAESVERSLTGATQRHRRGLQIFEGWTACFQWVKHRVWRSSNDSANNI